MKQFWMGVGILLVLLALGLGSTLWMGHVHRDLAQDLEEASLAALGEDWALAQNILSQCRIRWQACRGAVAAGASHEPIEQIDSLYAQLALYLDRRDSMGFALCCTTLQYQTQALGEAQAINWRNLL